MIPTFTIDIDTVEWNGLALVQDPAIESNFQFFSRASAPHIQFSIQDPSQHIVFGPCLRVNYPILRQEPDGSFYNIVFTPEVAQKMVSQFLSSDLSLNLSHTCIFPEGIEPLSFFIKDSSKGISPIGYDDIADGSIFCSYHISNPSLWSSVLDGTFKGFSIECFYDRNSVQDMSFSSLFTRFKQAFAELNVVKANPTDLFIEGDLIVGAKAYIDEVTPAPDGVYVSIADEPQDIVIANGIIDSITPHVNPVEVEVPDSDLGTKKLEEVNDVEPVAEVPQPVAEVPVPEVDPLDAIRAALDDLAARITVLESRLSDIEGAPAGALPADEFKSVKSSLNSFGTGIEAVRAMRAANKIR